MVYKSIKISEELKKHLDKLKVHPRETYEQLILRLASSYTIEKEERARE